MSTVDRLEAMVYDFLPERGDPTWYILGLSLALFIGFSIYMSLLYQSFWLTGADFGAYIHMFETTLSGNGWLEQGKYTPRGPEASYWGGHFTLTLLAFLPIYALFPSPYTLIVIKSFLLAASIPMLWVLARSHIESDRIAGLLTASYALNPFLWSAWLFDFQEQILLPILVFAAYYAYAKRRYIAFLVLLTLALLTNEFMVILTAGFLVGLAVAAYRGGRLRSEAPVFGVAVAVLVAVKLVSSWIISQFSPASGIPTDVIAGPIQPFVEGIRVGIGQLIAIVLAHPGLLIESVAVAIVDKAMFLVLLLVPVLFVAAVDEVSLGSLIPYLGFAWVFAGRSVYYTFGAHYPLYLLPFIYIGAVRVFGRIDFAAATDRAARARDRTERRTSARRVLSVLLALVLVVNVGVGVAFAAEQNAVPQTGKHTELLEEAIETVPKNTTLLTQNDIFPHVAARENATFTANRSLFYRYQKKHGMPTPEYILIDTQLETQHISWARPIRIIYSGQFGSPYGLAHYDRGIWIFKRGYNGTVQGIRGPPTFEPRVYKLAELIPNDAILINGNLVGYGGDNGAYFWYGPGAMLPPGNYTVTFRVNVTSTGTQPVVAFEVAAGVTPRAIASKTVTETNGFENVTVEFSLNQTRTNVEFRASQAGGEGRIALENITVESTGGPAIRLGNASATDVQSLRHVGGPRIGEFTETVRRNRKHRLGRAGGGPHGAELAERFVHVDRHRRVMTKGRYATD